ncbi:MAG TPA: DUF481 domain-containing protein [Polyangiales bacterium]|nr:DUF481 domain-containing protein [Polyangiales bacterium]
MRAGWWWVLCVFAFAGSAHAQVNAETLVESITKPGWGGGGKSTLSFSRGNVNLLEVRGDLSTYFATSHPDAPPGTDRFWFRDRILAYGSAGLKSLDGKGVANDGFGHLRYTRMHWLRFGSEVYLQAQYDKFRLLSRRLVAGAGLRVVFINYDRLRGWVGTGALLEFERRDILPENQPPRGPDPTDMTNPRSSSYITLIIPLVPERLSLIATAYVQPRWDIWRDVQVLHEAKLQVKVTGHLSINTDLGVRFDSRPPVSVERTDTRIGNSVQYSY